MNALSQYRAGVNLGGWLSQYQAYSHAHFQSFISPADLRQIARWGMDHVRLPVDYPVLEDDSAPLQYLKSGLRYIDNALEWCQAAGLRLILDLHRAPGFAFNNLKATSLFDDPFMQDRFLSLWSRLSERYANVGGELAFELLNEIVLPSPEPWKVLVRQAVEAIRKVDPDRIIVVGGNRYNSVNTLKELEIYDDPYVAYTFHFYLPMIVTHQKAYWIPALKDLQQAIDYPGAAPRLDEIKAHPHQAFAPYEDDLQRPLDAGLLRELAQPAFDFMKLTGHTPYCGEFGVIDQAPMPTRINWTRDFITLLNEHAIGRAYWSYKAMDFGLVDEQGQVVSEDLVKVSSVWRRK